MKNVPGFSAAGSLRPTSEQFEAEANLSSPEEAVIPAFQVFCGSNAFLGARCTILGGSMGLPCFFNSWCMWFHAGLANPACFSCTYV
jgi:hypothetical protein